ncbi:MAG: hypothetical protein FWD53_11560 [Phycisphaerales bacterium]|nr:hypothetical protein [Phycisphaerales bacterium]
MKTDTQHLDYLISQYVDGCLDTASKKSLEQTLVNDPQARQLYKDQHEVQDILDDWGNRIPMIDWDQFDKQLATRLQRETVGGWVGRRASLLQRWAKPLAIAASLFLAAAIGYFWNDLSHPTTTPTAHPVVVTPEPVKGHATVQLDDTITPAIPSFRSMTIAEPNALVTAPRTAVEITSPDDEVAATALQDALNHSLGTTKRPSSITAINATPTPPDKPPTPQYP